MRTAAVAAALMFMPFTADHGWRQSEMHRIREAPNHFQNASRISFRQLCFSFSRDGQIARDVATRAFRKVSGKGVDSDEGIANLADHFIFQSYYGNRTSEQVATVFGISFARALSQLKPGSWQGPIESESGWHLVWIDCITAGATSCEATVDQKVR